MKIRWWILGTIVVVAGGVFVVKHLLEDRDRLPYCVNDDSGKNINEVLNRIPASELDEIDFLV